MTPPAPGCISLARVASQISIAPLALRCASINLLLMLVVASACGCGASPMRATEPAPARRPLGPLAVLVPEGASTVVVARPDVLFASAAGPQIADTLVLPGGFDRFATRTGVDLRRLTEAVYVEYPDGASLVLVRGPFDAQLVVAEAGERMSAIESRADAPFVRRAGFFSDERRELVALDHDVVVVTSGAAVAPLAALLACVSSPERRCRTALSGRDAAALLAAHRVAPLAVYAPTGLALPEGFDTASLFAGTRALAAVVTLQSGDDLDLDVDLRGRFPADAEQNFRAFAQSLGRSELGAMLGLASAAERMTTARAAQTLRLHTTVTVAPLVHGLQVLFAGEISAILEQPSAQPPGLPQSAADVGATSENHK